MENGGGRRAMEKGVELRAMETRPRLPGRDVFMCSTCSGFVFMKKPKPNPDEVVEVVEEPEKMRDLLRAVLLHGPLQKMEPAEATKKQRQVLRRRRKILVKTKRCPACSGSPLEPCPPRFRSLLAKKPRPDEEDKEVSEFMALLRSEGRMEIATEDEAMVADARSSEHKLKRSREEDKISSSGSEKREEDKISSSGSEKREEDKISSSGSEKKAKGDDKEGSGSSKKKAKRSNEVEGSGSKEVEMEGRRYRVLSEEIFESVNRGVKTKVRLRRLLGTSEDIELAGGEWKKTKMVTQRLDKSCVDLLMNRPRRSPIPYEDLTDDIAAILKVDRLYHGYLQYQSIIKGYAEFQLEEVTDGKGDDWKL